MKKCNLQMQMYPLLLVLIFCSSCNAQVKTNTTANKVSEATATSTGQPRLIKNHFSDQYQAAADNVHCGLQDKAGNLWFGTTGDGVYRYDGKSFTNFTMKDGLDTNQILSILEDKTGNIWFGSRSGICRFDGKTITKIPIPVFNQNNFFPLVSSTHNYIAPNAVWSIMQDKKGTIWFGTDAGVYCFNGKTFTRFLDNTNIINQSRLTLKSVQCMLEDTKGNIWFGSGPMAFEGICLYDGKSLINFKPNKQQWVRKIEEGKNGVILFATRHAGIYYYDPGAGQTEGKILSSLPSPPNFFNGSLTYILEDKAGILWMGSDYGNNPGDSLGGVWRSNLSNDKIAEKTFTKIANKEVFFMLEDKDNNIWLGTRGTGLYRYDGKTITSFSE
jgi:ligand-binding sensor domain-containing protein